MDFNSYWAKKDNVSNRDSSEHYYRLKGLERNALLGDIAGGIADLGCGSGELTCELLKLRSNKFIGIDISEALIEDAKRNLKGFRDRVSLHCGDAIDLLKDIDSSVWISSGALGQYWNQDQIRELLDVFLSNSSSREIHLFDCIDPVKFKLLRWELLPSYKTNRKMSFKSFIKRTLGLILVFKDHVVLNKSYESIGEMGYAISPQFWLEIAKYLKLEVSLYSSIHYEYRYHVSLKKNDG